MYLLTNMVILYSSVDSVCSLMSLDGENYTSNLPSRSRLFSDAHTRQSDSLLDEIYIYFLHLPTPKVRRRRLKRHSHSGSKKSLSWPNSFDTPSVLSTFKQLTVAESQQS